MNSSSSSRKFADVLRFSYGRCRKFAGNCARIFIVVVYILTKMTETETKIQEVRDGIQKVRDEHKEIKNGIQEARDEQQELQDYFTKKKYNEIKANYIFSFQEINDFFKFDDEIFEKLERYISIRCNFKLKEYEINKRHSYFKAILDKIETISPELKEYFDTKFPNVINIIQDKLTSELKDIIIDLDNNDNKRIYNQTIEYHE